MSNGTNTVTMPGGSMNLSGAASVQAGAGVQAAGNATAVIVASPIVGVGAAGVTIGAALVGPIQVVKETGGRVIEDAAAVVEWVNGWF
ncbi:MAG: hypothetical protein WBW00_16735 [Pseudolabrys sp.]